jgi:hypothetical protein
MSSTTTDDPVSSVSALLDDGAWVLAQNRQACEEAAILAQEARALILTFRSHRFRPIAGADDLADDRERTRRGLRAFATFGIAKTWVGPSRGAVCDACGRKIAADEIEYELVAENGNEIRLDGDCYALLVNELATLPQGRAAAS